MAEHHRRTVADVGTLDRLVAAVIRSGLHADADELLAEASEQ